LLNKTLWLASGVLVLFLTTCASAPKSSYSEGIALLQFEIPEGDYIICAEIDNEINGLKENMKQYGHYEHSRNVQLRTAWAEAKARKAMLERLFQGPCRRV